MPATKTITKPAKQAAAKAAPAQASAMGQMAATVAALPAPVATPAKTVALRGGPAVSSVALTGAVYRTTAPHNQQWWLALSKSLAAGPVAVSGLLLTPEQPQGIPAHFVGYALRRGYLKAVA